MSSGFNTYLIRFAHMLMYAFTFVLVLFAMAISAVRLHPNVSDIVEAEIQYHLGKALNADIKIESLEISRFHPLSEIVAKNVEIIDRASHEVLGSVHLAQVRVNLLASLVSQSLRIQLIALDGLDVFVHRDKDGRFHLNQTFLMQGNTMGNEDASMYGGIDLSLLSANIRLKDDLTDTDYLFEDIDISIDPTLTGYRALVQGILPETIGSYVKMKIDIDGSLLEIDQSDIDFYIYAEKFRLSEMARRILDEEDAQKIPVILTTEAWGSVKNASLSSLRGFATVSDIVDQPNVKGPEFCLSDDYIRELTMQYEWESNDGNWVFKATDINVETSIKGWKQTELYIQQDKPSSTSKSIFAYLGEADIGEICNTLAAYSPHIVKFENQLDQFRFNSNLKDLKIRFDLSENYQTSFQYSVNISQAKAWLAEGNRSIDGLSAFLQGGDLGGRVRINSDALRFDMPILFPDFNIQLNAAGDIEWMHHADSFSLQSGKFVLKNDDLELLARLDVHKQGENIYTDSQFHVVRAKANRVGAYIPSTVGVDNTKSWLMNAIEEGTVTRGEGLLRGNLKNFPFQDASGVVKVNVEVDNGRLEYLSGWPELVNVKASARLNKNRLDVYSDQAGMYEDTQIKDVHVYIENFDEPVLNISGIANGPAKNMLDFTEDSKLLDDEQALSNLISLQGDASLKINIVKPVSKKIIEPIKVSGEIGFTDNLLDIHVVDLQLNTLNGVVSFDDRGFSGEDITASVFDTPVFISLTPQGNGVSMLNFESNFDLDEYVKDHSPEFARVLSGSVPIQGSIYLPDPGDSENPDGLEVSITSSLQGLEITLPAPFDKKSDTDWPLLIRYVQNDDSLDIDIDKKLYLDFAVSSEQPFDIRYIGVGENDRNAGAMLTDRLTIKGRIDELPLDDWLTQYKALSPEKQGTTKLSDFPDMDIAISQLDWSPWPARDIHLTGNAVDSGYNLKLESSHANGVIVLPKNRDNPVIVNMTSLTLPETGDEDAGQFDLNPDDLPPMTFSSKVLNTKHVSLKDVGFSIEPVQDGALINSITFAAHDMIGLGHGSWTEVDSGKTESAFEFNIESIDLEDTFKDLGFAGSIKKGEGYANLSLHWEGAPYDISVAGLAGKGEVEIKKGSIKELDPGAGRLLALVNLNAITRRLSLDFKDVTNEGFTFDSIRGRIQLAEGGELTARKVKIKSSAADIRISGSTNIIDKTYNQTVSVVPSLSGALPAAGAIVGGPVGAAAGVVADRLAQIVGLNKVVEYDYEITGTWEEPIIKRVTSREVEIQPNTPPSAAQPSGVQQSSQQ